MVKTKNFNPTGDPKLLCTCGHADCDKRSVNQETLDMAQKAREILGHSLRVTSGGRCPNHPEQARKANPNGGDHPNCRGLDIAVDGSTRGNVVRAGLDAGFNAIGVAKTFVHWGNREDVPEGYTVMWVY